jgi:hypothetical protein
MFDVDEREPRIPRPPGGADKAFDEAREVAVGDDSYRAIEPAVEQRVRIRGQRFRTMLRVRTREATGMRQLQTDEQIAVGGRTEALPMRRDERFAQACDRSARRVDEEQLIGVRAAVFADRDRLAPPHELRSTGAEVPPAARGEIARLAIGRAVPALHREDAEAIADVDAVALEWAAERRMAAGRELRVETEIDAGAHQIAGERVGRLEGREAGIAVGPYANLISYIT